MDKAVLKSIADNPVLLNAVRDIILKQFSLDEINVNQSNDEMGQVVRARIVGLRKVADGFREIETYKTIKLKSEGKNPAR